MRACGAKSSEIIEPFGAGARGRVIHSSMADRPKAFLDTSVWIAAILSDRGASYAILEYALQDRFVLVSSPDVYEEAVRNFKEKYPAQLFSFLAQFHRTRPLLVEPRRDTMLKAAEYVHPDDAPIFAGALEAVADHFVTLDRKHFLNHAAILHTHTGISVITPGDFLHVLK